MKKKQTEKMFYVKPECDIIQLEIGAFICTSVIPSPGMSVHAWDSESSSSGGSVSFGNPWTIAPAKQRTVMGDEAFEELEG